jgi:hypothetical protein
MVYMVGMDMDMGMDTGKNMDMDTAFHNKDMGGNLEQGHFQEPLLKDHQ